MKRLTIGIILATALLGTHLHAQEYTHGDLVIDQPYTRTTPPAAPVAGGFLKITNNGKEADTLMGGEVDFSEVVEIHEMPMVDGVMRMRQLENGLEIPPGETVELKPGGYHIMFIKLQEQMMEGDKHKATLNFAKAGEIEVEFTVRDISKAMGGMTHGNMKDDKTHCGMKNGGMKHNKTQCGMKHGEMKHDKTHCGMKSGEMKYDKAHCGMKHGDMKRDKTHCGMKHTQGDSKASEK